MYDITYNGSTAQSFGVYVTSRPDIPAPERNYDEYDVLGRDGSLIESDGTYKNIDIEIEMNYAEDEDQWMEKFREIKRWLMADIDKRLILSDDPDYFYKVKAISIGDNSRFVWQGAKFTPVFTCDPYQYRIDGQDTYDVDDVLFNQYAISHPCYVITGDGTCTLTVNGNVITAEVMSNLTIDTDLMISYRTGAYILADDDGLVLVDDDGKALWIWGESVVSSSITGEYEDLYLLMGGNEITISDGFELKIIPNWRCL